MSGNITLTLDRLRKAGVDLNTVRFSTDEQGRQWISHLLTDTPKEAVTPKAVKAEKVIKAKPGRPRYKLTEKDRTEILNLAKTTPQTYKEIGARFNVAPSTVCNIIKRHLGKKAKRHRTFLVAREAAVSV